METFSSEAVLILKPVVANTNPNLNPYPRSVLPESSEVEDPVSKNHWELVENQDVSPDISWTGQNTINLYSENVVPEGETTEEVNRESIRNLSSTRQQWETILTPLLEKPEVGSSNNSSSKKETTGSGVRHWEVDFPNKRKSLNIDVERVDIDVSSMTDTSATTTTTESAIEREIRLNVEREESLKREQEERKNMIERQKGKVDKTIYETVVKDEPKVMFHELTEADRGEEMWKRETIIQQELREQEQKEKDLRRNPPRESRAIENSETNGTSESTESIIEREIRIQREREAELHQQRKGRSARPPSPEPSSPPQPTTPAEPQNDINHNQTKNVSYQDAISTFQHDGESRIARELRETREREEELLRQREKLNLSRGGVSATPPRQQKPESITTTPNATTPKNTSSSSYRQVTWQKDVSPFLQKSKRSDSVESLDSSHSTGRTPSDTPGPQDYDDYRPKPETPIEREIRLARERENELRRSKGLPEMPDPRAEQRSGPPVTPTSASSGPRLSRSHADSSRTMKQYSSNRLQQEIIKQKQRELDLRKEGKIITTSEDHIEPMKYVAVTGQETANATVKRNYVTRKVSVGFVPPSRTDVTDDVDSAQSPNGGAGGVKTTPKADVVKSRKGLSSGGVGFSYKESRNTAESKIERELREMREREDELRKQRNKGEVASPNNSPREATANGKTDDEQTPSKRGHIAAQWEQVVNNN